MDRQDQWLILVLFDAAAGSTLRDAGTGKDASTSLAAGDGSLTEATLLCCSASTESTGSGVALWEEIFHFLNHKD